MFYGFRERFEFDSKRILIVSPPPTNSLRVVEYNQHTGTVNELCQFSIESMITSEMSGTCEEHIVDAMFVDDLRSEYIMVITQLWADVKIKTIVRILKVVSQAEA